MKFRLILNEASGAGRGAELERVADALAGTDMQAGLHVVPPSEVVAAARQAAASDAQVIVACGGDGTVRAVAQALVGTDKALAVLPFGTLNHFAAALGVAPSWSEALAALPSGQPRRVDVGELNGHVFLNNSSIGIYPEIVTLREVAMTRSRRSKWVAFAWAALKATRRLKLMDVSLESAAGTLRRRTPFVFVGNNAYDLRLPYFGDRPRLDAGELCVYVADYFSKSDLMLTAMGAMLGRQAELEHLDAFALREVDVHTDHRSLRVSLDGEVLRLSPPLRYRSRAQALTVFAPAPGTTRDAALAYGDADSRPHLRPALRSP